jgi:hypothetical protein
VATPKPRLKSDIKPLEHPKNGALEETRGDSKPRRLLEYDKIPGRMAGVNRMEGQRIKKI